MIPGIIRALSTALLLVAVQHLFGLHLSPGGVFLLGAIAVPDVSEDIGAFAKNVLHRPLWPHQLAVALSDKFVAVVAGARRTGKTELAQVLAIWTAMRVAGCTVVIISATADQARRVTEGIAGTLAANSLTRLAVVDDFATRITFANGSTIMSIPASQARGLGKGVLLVVYDEAGFAPPEAWAAVRYIALDERARGSRILLIGSPWGGADHFFRRSFLAGQDGDEDYASFQWAHTVNPLLDTAYLERERLRTAPAEFLAEVMGEWTDGQGSMFSRALIERATVDAEVVTPW